MTPADLAPHLAERIRPAGEPVAVVAGELVLYWMHHAVRAEENPALDTAIAAAGALDLPLLVYQGLGGRHAYDSDRHHTFILEGAREVAAALATRGVRHVFRLAPSSEQSSPLRGLAERAALVVTEDFPAPPFPTWTRALARRIAAPVWQVDTACVLPMRLADRPFARAFEFRRAHGEALLQRARTPWPETDATAPAFEGRLGFEPVDLEQADLPALCAACEIDHAVGPVPMTRGGTGAALDALVVVRRLGPRGIRPLAQRRRDRASPGREPDLALSPPRPSLAVSRRPGGGRPGVAGRREVSGRAADLA